MSASEVESTSLIGVLIADRYEIVREVARGSMGSVWAAVHRPLDREVAIKMLDVRSAHTVSDTQSAGRDRKRFLREASLLSRLTHPHTVRVFDFGLHDDTPYIVMELVKGDTLRQILRKRRQMNPVRALRIARQICGSLGEAHDMGLVHRDLKPANVLVSRDIDGDLVKVVDFGLVKEVRDAVHMTGDGMMIGTPMYMAPEQIRGRPVDQRCDLYALGVVLFRMLMGRPPFVEDQTAALLVAHITDPVPSFDEIDPDHGLPRCVEWTVRRCLEKEPEDRFASAREFARALKVCEAVLLDPVNVTEPEMSLVDGRLSLPNSALLQQTSSHDVVDLTTVRRLRMRRMVRMAMLAAGLMIAMVFALTFGFVIARGVLAFVQRPDAPVAAPAPPSAPAPALPVAPAPVPVDGGRGVDDGSDEGAGEDEVDAGAPADEAVEPAPSPAPEPAAPRPRASPSPSPSPSPRPAAPAPAPASSAEPEPTPDEPAVAVDEPEPQDTPDPEPEPLPGSDLVDPWSTDGGSQ